MSISKQHLQGDLNKELLKMIHQFTHPSTFEKACDDLEQIIQQKHQAIQESFNLREMNTSLSDLNSHLQETNEQLQTDLNIFKQKYARLKQQKLELMKYFKSEKEHLALKQMNE